MTFFIQRVAGQEQINQVMYAQALLSWLNHHTHAVAMKLNQ